MKIALIIPYFGKWPKHFNLYLEGLSNNTFLDVIFFTDCDCSNIIFPSNAHIHYYTFENILSLVKTKLGYSLEIQNTYKLCDFKPAYGKIFEDYLVSYEYWGYGDIDLIYGDLEKFIMPRIEKGFSILSSRNEIMSGSFSLFKNEVNIASLFNKIPDFEKNLATNEYISMDETCFDEVTWKGGKKEDLNPNCFTFVVNQQVAEAVSFETICVEKLIEGDLLEKKNTKLYFNGKEIAYFHYVCNKSDIKFFFRYWNKCPSSFYINYTGFYLSKNNLKLKTTFRLSVAFLIRAFNKVLKTPKSV